MENDKYREYISSNSENNLEKEILELIKLFPEVKEYYDLKINPKLEEKLLEKYKKVIKEEFFPINKEVKMRYSIVSKAIIDFQRKAQIDDNIAEIMIYYVEVALKFIHDYKEVGEKFYISVEGTFAKVLDYILKNKLKDKFYNRVNNIVEKTTNMDKEFERSMKEIYNKNFT